MKKKKISRCKCNRLEIVMILFTVTSASEIIIVHRKLDFVFFLIFAWSLTCSFFIFAYLLLSLSPLRTRSLYAAPNEKNKRNYEPNATDVTSDYAQLSTSLEIIHPTCINSFRRLTLRSLSPVSVSTFFTA